MSLLFKNANIIDADFTSQSDMDLLVEKGRIARISASGDAEITANRTIEASGMLLIPALYNAHTHIPMSLLKGFAEDMSLQDWLFGHIAPAEEKLDYESVYWGSMLSAAEMIKNGVVSCTDMYSFCESITRAVAESGMKINVSRAVLSFNPNENMADNIRFNEAKRLHKWFHKQENGRILVDMSVHAEYTSTPAAVRAVGDYAAENGLRTHIHISETKREHMECIERHGVTPLGYFDREGFFRVPSTAAHCVFVSGDDIALMNERSITAAHCPASNLKLASGIAKIPDMIAGGVNVALGTDGSASNNSLDIMKEMYLAAILHKGAENNPSAIPAKTALKMATVNAAKAQGRDDCGVLREGARADITVIDLSAVECIPSYDGLNTVVYSANTGCVYMTMCDGLVLYENGEYTAIDIERIKYEAARISRIFR